MVLQEEIEAKRESAGNYCAMMLLLDNLRRRENWPGQFITALQQIEQPGLANLISDAYNKIRGIHSMFISVTYAQQRAFTALLTNKTVTKTSTNKQYRYVTFLFVTIVLY